jgi:hypothetical protein
VLLVFDEIDSDVKSITYLLFNRTELFDLSGKKSRLMSGDSLPYLLRYSSNLAMARDDTKVYDQVKDYSHNSRGRLFGRARLTSGGVSPEQAQASQVAAFSAICGRLRTV